MEMLVLEKAQWAAISFRSGKSSGGAMLVHKKILHLWTRPMLLELSIRSDIINSF